MALLNPSDTQYYFDVVDGWGGNLDTGGAISDSIQPALVHTWLASGASTPLPRGCVVMSSHDGTVPTVEIPLTDANVNLDADKRSPKRFWMVVSGNTTYDYDGRQFNKVVCLRGNFAVETAHVNGSLSNGDAVTVEHAAGGTVGATLPHLDVGGIPGTNSGRLTVAAAGDPIFGRVVDQRIEEGVTVYTIEMDL